MTFVDAFNSLPLAALEQRSLDTTDEQARRALNQPRPTLADFAHLISPAAGGLLETLCQRSQTLTRRRFGKVIRLFAPLYLSNECINNCQYCGFSRDNPILRVTLAIEEVLAEARALKAPGFRNLLLVAGQPPPVGRGPRLGDGDDVARAGVHGGVLHRALLHLGDAGGDRDDDAGADAQGVVVHLADEVTEHGLRDIEVRDDAILHGTDGGDVAGGAPQHAFGLVPNGADLAGGGVKGDDGRFTQDDATVLQVDESVGRAQIDADVVGEVIEQVRSHELSCFRRRKTIGRPPYCQR